MTAKSPVDAVVAFSASLYVNVNIVPAEFTATELYVGGVKSTVEAFPFVVIERSAIVAASFPDVS